MMVGVLLLLVALSATAQGPRGFVRVINLSPDAPPLDLWINGESRSTMKEWVFKDASGWILQPAGPTEFEARFTGRSRALFGGPVTFELGEGERMNIVITGSSFFGQLMANVLPEDDSELPSNTARVTFFHAVEGGPVVDILSGEELLIGRLGYPGSLTLPGGGTNDGAVTLDLDAIGETANLSVVPNGQTGPALAEASLTLQAGGHYFVAIAGTTDAVEAVVLETLPE
jgi:hypothetical protein